MTPLIMVIKILISERDAKHPLADQSHDLVLNAVWTPQIVKTRCESLHRADRTIGRAEQQRTASGVTGPASNAATTFRPSTGANSKKFGARSVGIGVLRESEINCWGTTISLIRSPDALN